MIRVPVVAARSTRNVMAKRHSVLILTLLATAANAAIWPEQFAKAKRTTVAPVTVQDQKIWSEYGLQETEKADFGGFSAIAYRLQDPTAALAAFYWQRPKDGKPSPLGKYTAETANSLMIAHGNYLLDFQGLKPSTADLEGLFQQLPKLDQSPLPALVGYMPSDGMTPNSERYVVGPVSLEAFYPGIQAGLAAFHFGSEAEIATFGDMKLAIFSYPTPNIARDRLVEFDKAPGALAKRSGPLVAVILAPADTNAAERLLSQVRYQASISWSQYVPSRRDNIGDLIVNAFILIGVLLVFSTVAGLAFGGFRLLRRRVRAEEPEAMTVLHLGEH
jgi:hypothetical protein